VLWGTIKRLVSICFPVFEAFLIVLYSQFEYLQLVIQKQMAGFEFRTAEAQHLSIGPRSCEAKAQNYCGYKL